MRRTLTLAVLASLPLASQAAPVIGEMTILSAPGTAFRAEFALAARSPADLTNLQAGLMTRAAQMGGAMREWERQASFRLEARNDGAYVLIVESAHPIDEQQVDLTLGVDSATGNITRDYALDYRDGAWATAASQRAPVRTAAAVQRPDMPASARNAHDLQVSAGLTFVIPFADGRVRLGPKGRAAVAELAGIASGTERIQGWAGEQAGPPASRWPSTAPTRCATTSRNSG